MPRITLDVTDSVYNQASETAQQTGQSIDQFILHLLHQQLTVRSVSNKTTPRQQAFLAEVAAFERLKPALLKTHRGQFVAIYQGQLVAEGDDELELTRRVDQQFGEVACYIEFVTEETPRRARLTSAWKARS